MTEDSAKAKQTAKRQPAGDLVTLTLRRLDRAEGELLTEKGL